MGYNLMMNGQMDDVMDAFQGDRSRGNSRAKQFIGDDAEYYDYYFPPSSPQLPAANAWPLPPIWKTALACPWESEYGDLNTPDVPVGSALKPEELPRPMERAHVIPKAVLRDFYRELVKLRSDENEAEIKIALEPLFD